MTLNDSEVKTLMKNLADIQAGVVDLRSALAEAQSARNHQDILIDTMIACLHDVVAQGNFTSRTIAKECLTRVVEQYRLKIYEEKPSA